MTYHAQLNLIMLATIVVLVIFLYVRPSDDASLIEYPVSELKQELPQTIRIVRNNHEIHLVSSNNHWQLVQPITAEADEEKVEQILSVLGASSSQRFPVSDKTRLGLDQPVVELFVDHHHFKFGGLAPTTNLQYLETGSGIYLVSPRYAVFMPVNPIDMVSKYLLAKHELPVRFQVQHFDAILQAGVWKVSESSQTTEIDQHSLENWLQQWQKVKAEHVTLHAQPVVADENESIMITLNNDKIIRFNVSYHESGVVLSRVGQYYSYHFPVNEGRKLANPAHLISD